MRTPIVVGPEPYVPIIVGLLFVIPAERVAAVLCGSRVEEYPREVTPSSFNSGRGSARALVRYHQDVKAGFPDRAFVRRRGSAQDVGAGDDGLGNDFLSENAHGLHQLFHRRRLTPVRLSSSFSGNSACRSDFHGSDLHPHGGNGRREFGLARRTASIVSVIGSVYRENSHDELRG